MATLPSAQYVRDLSVSGEFATVSDATIEGIRDDDVVPVYSATDVKTHTQWTRAVGLHTAHILHVQAKLEGSGGDFSALAAATSRGLQGIGARTRAVGALNPSDVTDLMKIPTIYLARLQRILITFPASIYATGGV